MIYIHNKQKKQNKQRDNYCIEGILHTCIKHKVFYMKTSFNQTIDWFQIRLIMFLITMYNKNERAMPSGNKIQIQKVQREMMEHILCSLK